MTKISSKLVLITGGASGIGKIMGREVLKHGGKLVIWDVDKLNLQGTLDEFKELGQVYGYTIDITNTVWVKEMARQVEDEIGNIDILINNAGIVYGGYFHENSSEKIEKTMKVNAIAPMQLALTFLPGMMKRKQSHICNITSSAGLVSNPKMAVYAGSKWAATGWSDSLRLEMKQLKTGVGVTTVTPYYINTGMFDGVKSNIPILDQYNVAKKVIKAIQKNRIYLSMPWSMRFVRFSQGLFPIWFYDWFVGRLIGVYKTMDDFKGRKK
ncbi:SDR family oxidoreductase [Salegentibacter agarivorans]|jgi:short-subunit dehydrogenase|uniref:SDR family oxidoreductase n=1 Tax=Salegentibacter sp. BDJ18 TaxID=2816376 RepID=UPI001AAF9884|nr:SDR family oxidoreductase [Salegentibacter sp. BDJ18]MBO2545936.1 SDR family oxidoreductase [Salegentibacter sp. BDJ18]